MFKWKSLIYVAILIVVAGVIYFWNYRRNIIEVKVVEVKRGAIERTVTSVSSGTVEPMKRVRMQALLPLRIKEVNFKEGERVKANDVIVKLDDSEIKIKLELQEAALRTTELRLREIEERYRLSKLNYDRIKNLFEQGVVSEGAFDEVKGQFTTTEKEFEVAKNAINEAKLSSRLTGEELEKTNIRAPFNGLISFLDATPGEIPPYSSTELALLSSQTTSSSENKPFLEIIDDSVLRVKAPFDEVDATKIRRGKDARITSDTVPDTIFKGKVVYISPVVSKTLEQNRTVDVEFDIENSGKEQIPVGASVDVEIILEVKEGMIIVPTNTVIERDGARFVYKVENNLIKKRPIKIGISNWEYTEILDGLKEGDRVVTSLDVQGLEDGKRIKISDEK